MASQIQLDFTGGDDRGFAKWQSETTGRRHALARKLGLPIGRAVEVELRCGQILRGRLVLREPAGKRPHDTVELEVDGVPFPPAEAVRWLVTD